MKTFFKQFELKSIDREIEDYLSKKRKKKEIEDKMV